MNEGFAPIAAEIRKARTIAVLSHVRPDGDAMWSPPRITLSLLDLGKLDDAWNEDGLPEAFSFLSRSELVTVPPKAAKAFDLVIALDTATRDRLGAPLQAIKQAGCWSKINHHLAN